MHLNSRMLNVSLKDAATTIIRGKMVRRQIEEEDREGKGVMPASTKNNK